MNNFIVLTRLYSWAEWVKHCLVRNQSFFSHRSPFGFVLLFYKSVEKVALLKANILDSASLCGQGQADPDRSQLPDYDKLKLQDKREAKIYSFGIMVIPIHTYYG